MSALPEWKIIDPATLDRIIEILQIRNVSEPDERRGAALEQLRRIRHRMVRNDVGWDAIDIEEHAAMFTMLLELERGSLGTARARRLRGSATAARVACILDRSEDADL